ncbi:MAG TPA: ATP-grasp domain-containing protein [Candidatus Nitrosotalea sp.]|nr:ATP-grasp domain-containing protein [Candidatus Nitrosotalea sp.]
MNMQNVLVTSAGSIVGQGIIKCLRLANEKNTIDAKYRIVAADMSARAPGLYRADAGFLVPAALTSEYLDFIIKLCIEERIMAIFIGSDEETIPLSEARDDIENKSGAVVMANHPITTTIASDKWETYKFLRRNNLPHPESALPEDREKFVKEYGFPLVVKPREGHGSLHFYIVRNEDELTRAVSAIQRVGWKPLLQEFLGAEDTEYTSGVTVSRDGKIMSSISMRKILKGGQTYRAFIDDYKDVRKAAERVAVKIGAVGAINIQAKVSKGEIKTFEINPRFSATCPLRAVAGINEPDIVFRNVLYDEKIRLKKYQRLVCMRYWNEVYVPYATYENTQRAGSVQTTDSFIPSYF